MTLTKSQGHGINLETIRNKILFPKFIDWLCWNSVYELARRTAQTLNPLTAGTRKVLHVSLWQKVTLYLPCLFVMRVYSTLVFLFLCDLSFELYFSEISKLLWVWVLLRCNRTKNKISYFNSCLFIAHTIGIPSANTFGVLLGRLWYQRACTMPTPHNLRRQTKRVRVLCASLFLNV